MASFTTSIPTFFNALTSTLPRKCLTSSLIWLTADSLSQHLIEKRHLSSHDFMRSLKHSIYSGVILAPSLAIWSNLTKQVVLRTNSRTVAARVALDQLVMAVVGLSMFGSYCTLTSGGGSKDIIERLDRTWKTTLTTSWSIWIPAQFVNYALVPPQQRILVMNITSLIWSCYLSNAAHGAVSVPSPIHLSHPVEAPIPQVIHHFNHNSSSDSSPSSSSSRSSSSRFPSYHQVSNWGRLHL